MTWSDAFVSVTLFVLLAALLFCMGYAEHTEAMAKIIAGCK